MRRKKKEKTRKTKKRNTRARRFKNYLVLFVGKGRRPNALRGPGARARARARAKYPDIKNYFLFKSIQSLDTAAAGSWEIVPQ